MKKIIVMISLLLSISLMLTGCRGALKAVGNDLKEEAEKMAEDAKNAEKESDSISEEMTEEDNQDSDIDESDASPKSPDTGKFECISDISDYWTDIYSFNETAINAYEGMPIMELVTPGLCFVTGVQYDMLNIFNEEGRHEGALMLAGYPGFVEKKGSELTFGYDTTITEDSEYSDVLKGDKVVENGKCDLDKGYYYAESYTDRAGEKRERSANEFALQSDNSMCTLVIEGKNYGYNKEADPTTSYIFIRGGEGLYDFAVANSTQGSGFENLQLKNDMTKDEAITMFKNAGAAILYSGGIKDGLFYID